MSGVLTIVSALITEPTCVVSVCSQRGIAGHSDRFVDHADLHVNVEARSLVHFQCHAGLHRGFESLGFDLQRVRADRDSGEMRKIPS